MTLPYVHKQPCLCTNCDSVRRNAFTGPGVYKSIASPYNERGVATWTLERFVWGEPVGAGEHVWVERRVVNPENGWHVDGVVIWRLEGDLVDFTKKSTLCTSIRSLEPA